MEKIITDYEQAKAAGLLREGYYFVHVPTGRKLYLPFYFGNRLDLDKMEIHYCASTTGKEFPDLNALVKEGIIKIEPFFKEHEVYLDKYPHCDTRRKLNGKKIDAILKEFREHGFNVTLEAIMHNYCAWLEDRKSGYLDKENSYHLFTPCGCNPLRFNATTLFETCDWQETYAG